MWKGNGRSVRQAPTLLVLPLFVLVSLVFSHAMLPWYSVSVPSTRQAFDPALQAFILGWDWQTLPRDPLQLFDAPIFYPERRTLTYMDHMVGEAIVAAPIFAATNSIAAGYNFLFLFASVLSAWATYRLVRLIGTPRPGAWLCGFLFTFSPYRAGNVDLLNQLQTEFLPLGLFFAVRYLQRWKLRDIVSLAGVFLVQVYFGWYYTFFLATALALLVLYALIQRRWTPPREHIGVLVLLGLSVALASFPVTWPYILQGMAMPGFRRSLGQTALYSADVLDYLRVAPRSVAAQILPLPAGGQCYWPGTFAAVLGIVGAWVIMKNAGMAVPHQGGNPAGSPVSLHRAVDSFRCRARRLGSAGYFLVLAPVSFVLSLGPVLHVGGIFTWVPLPYALLYYIVPGYSSMRAPARFAVLTTLAVVALAAYGYRALHERWGKRTPGRWRTVAAFLFVGAIVMAWSPPISLMPIPTRASMPPIYRWLAERPGQDPVIEFPVAASDVEEDEQYALRQFYTLYTGKPRLDGSSGFVSEQYRSFRGAVASFPSTDALDAIREMEGRIVVIHFADYPDSARSKLRMDVASERRLEPIVQFDDDRAFLLRP